MSVSIWFLFLFGSFCVISKSLWKFQISLVVRATQIRYIFKPHVYETLHSRVRERYKSFLKVNDLIFGSFDFSLSVHFNDIGHTANIRYKVQYDDFLFAVRQA